MAPDNITLIGSENIAIPEKSFSFGFSKEPSEARVNIPTLEPADALAKKLGADLVTPIPLNVLVAEDSNVGLGADEPIEYEGWKRPPGLVGTITDFIYRAAPSPLIEVALAAAIAFMSGIVGRAYNVRGMGLNQFLVILADTGAGKNAAKTGIDKLDAAIWTQYAVARRKGLGGIASSQALAKSIIGDGKSNRLCSLSVFGEIGLWLQNLCNKRANPNDVGIRRALLDLYTCSGGSKRFGDIGYSDTSKNVAEAIAPAYSFLGDSTQQEFYKAVNEESVGEGFLPRLTIIEYPLRKLPEPNHDHANATPSPQLLLELATLIRNVNVFENNQDNLHAYNWRDVTLDEYASEFDRELEVKIRRNMESHNTDGKEHLSKIWTRFREKTLRLAALLAVGVDPNNPVITRDEMSWAHDLVIRGTEILIKRFESGRVGEASNSTKQRRVLGDFLVAYSKTKWTVELENKYRVTKPMHELKLIPKSYIARRLINASAFSSDNFPNKALDAAIEHFVTTTAIAEFDAADQLRSRKGMKAYQIRDVSKLRD